MNTSRHSNPLPETSTQILTKLSLSAASFLACSLGWLLTYLGWVVYTSVTSIYPGGQDLIVIGSWSALFGVLIWLCLYLPYALWFPRGPSWLYRFPGNVLIGLGLGLLGYFGFYFLLFCPFVSLEHCFNGLLTPDIAWFPLFAGAVGIAAGLLFPFLLVAFQHLSSRITWGLAIVLAFVGVPGMLWASLTILWPALIERYPSAAYPYVDLLQQRQIYLQILSSTRVNDTFDSLREKLPQKFLPNFREDRGFLGRQFYAIEIRDGVVASVHVDPRPEPGPSATRISYIFPEGFTGWGHVCYATPDAAPLPLEGGHMTIKFPSSGLVVTSTAPTIGGYPATFFRLEVDGPRALKLRPKDEEVGIVVQYFGTPTSYDKNRTATLRLAERTFVGTNAQMKNTPASMGSVFRCPPGIVRMY